MGSLRLCKQKCAALSQEAIQCTPRGTIYTYTHTRALCSVSSRDEIYKTALLDKMHAIYNMLFC